VANLIGDMARSFGLPRLKRAAGWVTRLLPVPEPVLLVGAGASVRLGQAIGAFRHRRLLVVTDPQILALGLAAPLLEALAEGGTPFVVFDGVEADAPIPSIERGIAAFGTQGCDALLAIGGGSAMDTAKTIGLSVANDRHPRRLVGYFRGRHGPPPLYAVPTTAGTGSEATVAAVISDPATHRKLVIADTRLVPTMAALDPALMTGLSPAITAATGMDALTHAIEARIGDWATPFTDRMAGAAVALIYRWLPRAFDDGADLAAREQMALASTFAGLAFTRANVGNVHAIAHQIGGLYHTPHGLANAIVLPKVLRFCAAAAEPRLAALAVHAGVSVAGEADADGARRFIESVEALNARLGIPTRLDALHEDDIGALAVAACREADGNYPVPRVMAKADCESLLRELLPQRTAAATPRRRRTVSGSRRPAAAASLPGTAAPRRAPPAPRAGRG
jgi:alcohol dehydrogenase class IV